MAVQTRTPIGDFIKSLVKEGHDFCSDYDEHKIGINTLKGNLPDGVNDNARADIIIKKEELDFARWGSGIEHRSIWPIVVKKALEAIEPEVRPDTNQLVDMGKREERFDCEKAHAPYLCKVSDLVSRLTGVRMHTTSPLLKSKTPQSEIDIEKILNGATGGIGIVFDKQAPRFLMQSSMNNDGKEYKDKGFFGVQLGIRKVGDESETKYDVYGIGDSWGYYYPSIMDEGEGRDIRLVVPY